MAALRIDSKIVQYSRGVKPVAIENLVPRPEMAFQKMDEPLEIDFLRPVIEGKVDQIGDGEKYEEDEAQSKTFCQPLKLHFEFVYGKGKGDEKER
jgi:hypothetical protein